MEPRRSGVYGRRRVWVILTAALLAVITLILVSTSTARSAPARAKSADAFVDSIGVNTHMNYFDTAYNNYPLIKRKLETLGVRHARDKAHLGSSDYNSAVYGRYRNLYNSTGIKFNLMVDPRNLGLRSVDQRKVANIKALAGSSLESLEGPNEYDVSGAGNWAGDLRSYQRNLYRSTKANGSTSRLPVLAPALAHARNADALGDLSPYLDYGNLHPYPGGRAPTHDLDGYNISNTRKVSRNKPLRPTETGYHTAARWNGPHPGVSERAAGRYMPRLFLEYFNRGISRTYSYELIDLKPDPRGLDREKNFGLLRNDGTEKPAYRSMKNLISVLDDPGRSFKPGSLDYSLTGDTRNVHRTLLQKRDGTFYLILWQEVSGYNLNTKRDVPVPGRNVTLNVNKTVGGAATYLTNNSANPTKRYSAGQARRLSLTVPDHPLVVEISPQAQKPDPSPRSGSLPALYRDGTWLLRDSLSTGQPDNVFSYGGTRRGTTPLLGDWNGDGKKTAGIYRNGTWYLKNSNKGGRADLSFSYGGSGTPVVGDWNGDGTDTIGVVRDGTFYLKNSNKGGRADTQFSYGRLNDKPIVGDWDGDGKDTAGLAREGSFYLKNSNRGGRADIRFSYGRSNDKPVAGDWNGNGRDTVGIVRGGTWYLKNANKGGRADIRFSYGRSNDTPLVGGR